VQKAGWGTLATHQCVMQPHAKEQSLIILNFNVWLLSLVTSARHFQMISAMSRFTM